MNRKSGVVFVGTIWYKNSDSIKELHEICKKNNLKFKNITGISVFRNIYLVQKAYLAPAIQGTSHCKSDSEFYIPCRITKNISYGALGITNNLGVYEYYNKMISYSEDFSDLIKKTEECLNSNDFLEKQFFVMDRIKQQETYLSRILTQLNLLKKQNFRMKK